MKSGPETCFECLEIMGDLLVNRPTLNLAIQRRSRFLLWLFMNYLDIERSVTSGELYLFLSTAKLRGVAATFCGIVFV
jgi:hypothetical protein